MGGTIEIPMSVLILEFCLQIVNRLEVYWPPPTSDLFGVGV